MTSNETNESILPNVGVIKLSESALYLNGNYVGEVGNRFNPSPKEMFTWYPTLGLSIESSRRDQFNKKKIFEIQPSDMLGLPHDMGFITLSRLLPDHDVILNDSDFERIVYQLYGLVKEKVDLIRTIDRITNHRFTNWTIDNCIKRASQKNHLYSPEQLLDELLLELVNPERWDDDQTIGERIKATGILELLPDMMSHSLFSFLYLFGKIVGADMSNALAVKRVLYEFPFTEQLLQEYSSNPDIRFGDAILVACQLLNQERENEDNKDSTEFQLVN